MYKNLKIITTIFIMFFIFNCNKQNKNIIKIGVAGAHSGDLASYGLPTLHAVNIIADEINAKGGINGKTIQILAEDDACKPEAAVNIAAKLSGQKVAAVIGHICSGATKAALGIYKDSKIICISPSATKPDLTQSKNYPNFFRTIAPDNTQALLQVEFAVNTLNLKTIAVIHDKGDYGKTLAEWAKKFIEESGKAEVVLYEGVTPGAVDYTAVVNKIKTSGAQAILYGGYHPEASKIVTQIRKQNMDTIFISGDGIKSDQFINITKEYSEGVYASGPANDKANNLIYAEAKNKYLEKYNSEPGNFYYEAYSAMLSLINAITKAESTDYSKLVKVLRTEETDTPVGKIKYDDKGDAIGVGFTMYQIINGEYIEVK